jgi:ferredoxin
MKRGIYRKLAQRLDAIPNGFPQTESGVELKLLARLFTPKEATIASQMKLAPETSEQMAERIGETVDKTEDLLKEMVEKGLIKARSKDGQTKYGLKPFIVGIYESQLGRLDAEMAHLFEEYYEAFAQGVLTMNPSLHKIIPVEKSIPFEVQVFPFEQASQILEAQKSFGVQKCICRVQKRLVGKPCKYSEDVCLVFASTENAFENASNIRTLTKEQAMTLLLDTEKAGLIHSSANIQQGHGYICNCCTCCCGIIRGISLFGLANTDAKSNFYSETNSDLCTGCGVCEIRCQFHAITIMDSKSSIDRTRCVGCGQCVMICPSNALTLKRKPKKEIIIPPKDQTEWMKTRAKNRGIDIKKIL